MAGRTRRRAMNSAWAASIASAGCPDDPGCARGYPQPQVVDQMPRRRRCTSRVIRTKEASTAVSRSWTRQQPGRVARCRRRRWRVRSVVRACRGDGQARASRGLAKYQRRFGCRPVVLPEPDRCSSQAPTFTHGGRGGPLQPDAREGAQTATPNACGLAGSTRLRVITTGYARKRVRSDHITRQCISAGTRAQATPAAVAVRHGCRGSQAT